MRYSGFCSVSKSQEASDTTSNPFSWLLFGWQFHVLDEVGRVTSGRQGTCSGKYFVHWNIINACFWLLSVSLRDEPDQWELHVKLLWLGVIQHVSCLVPSGSFDVETEAIHTINWFLSNILWLNLVIDFEVISELINSNGMLSGEVLSGTCEESLWEEESREPEGSW
jgi:hypothetical protein